MSDHTKAMSPELERSLLDHGLPAYKPSQLADSFRNGWNAAQEAAMTPEQAWEDFVTALRDSAPSSYYKMVMQTTANDYRELFLSAVKSKITK